MSQDWKNYVQSDGSFELPTFLYNLIQTRMKHALDLGTLLSSDPQKTRAFKEQIKKDFKQAWLDIAAAFEHFEIIARCECFGTNKFCPLCGGSRYQLNQVMFPGASRETAFITANDNPTLSKQLSDGLTKALQEVENLE